ncbi:hypothetical protein AB0J42_35390 [Nonomuraea sp. NPDC049649]
MVILLQDLVLDVAVAELISICDTNDAEAAIAPKCPRKYML